MARALNKLTDRRVQALKEPGRHSDGGGLYLRITPQGARSWLFMAAIGGKRQEIGLGPESSVSLKAARRIAEKMREAVALGTDPRAALPRNEDAAPAALTFGAFAEDYISRVEWAWKNPVHRQQWRNSLRDHAAAIRDKALADITTGDVLAVLQPIWLTKAETASRVRGRIEKILSAALAEGHIARPYENPARWRGHLEHSLPKQPKLARGHHAALPYADAAAFMAELRKRSAMSARCLEFTILTAARSGEALEATWGEVDMVGAVWTIPAEKMKAGKLHRVPLSPAALAVLAGVRPDKPQAADSVFGITGAPQSNMAMTRLLERMGRDDITVHGFRSTFRDWAGDATGHAHQVIEAALAHTIKNKAEAAYARSDLFEKRRVMMCEWADYLAGVKLEPEPTTPDADAIAAALAAGKLSPELVAALAKAIGASEVGKVEAEPAPAEPEQTARKPRREKKPNPHQTALFGG